MSIKAPLVPARFSKIVRTTKRVGIFGELLLITALLPLFFLAGVQDIETIIILLLTYSVVFVFALVPGLMYDGLCHMVAVFSENKFCIFDKKGICRRECTYEQITYVCVQEVSGFFWGINRERVKNEYICFFLNNETGVPDVSYSRLFRQEKFIMVSYQEELYGALKALPLNMGERQ